MALVLKDRVLESSTSTGTGTFTLTGAQTGYQSFSVIGNGNTVYYTIQGKDANGNLTGEWEVGTGTWSTDNTLSRDTVLESSNANAKVVFSAGSKDVFCDLPAEVAVYQDALGTVTVPQLAISSITSTTPTLSFNGSNTNLASGATVSGSYLQSILQNKSGTAGASTNYVLSNDLGTDSTYYGEFGMNSSVYSRGTPTDFFSLNNGIYYSGHDGDISLGSGNGYKTYFAWGTAGQSAHVINASGAIGLNTNITGSTNFGTANQFMQSAGSAATPIWSSTLSGATINNTNTITVKGSLFTLQDDTDTTKQANFDLSGLTTGTTYSYKLPAVTGSTLASIGLAQTWTAGQTFNGGIGVSLGQTTTLGGSVTMNTVGNVIAIGTSQTTGTTTIGSTAQTGTLTFGQSTAAQTVNIATGVTAASTTKAVNIGTAGNATSTTNIAIGSTTGTSTTTLNGTVKTNSAFTLQDATDNTKQANFVLSGLTTGTTYAYTLPAVSGAALATLGNTGSQQVFSGTVGFGATLSATSGLNLTGSTGTTTLLGTSATTGTTTIGGASQTGAITLGQSTVSQTVNVSNGVTASGSTNTINIGTAGATGSTTAITIGSPAGTSTTTLNGNVSFANTVTAPTLVASNGIHVNSQTVAASYSIPSGSSAMSAGPITVASGQTVTVPTGSRWVIV